MTAVLGAIATHQKSLHLAGLVLTDLEQFRHHAAIEAHNDLPHRGLVLDDMIAAAFMPVVVQLNGLAADVAHEPRLLPTAGLIERDQLLAELGLEHIRQYQNGGLHFEAREASRYRRRFEEGQYLHA